jgi:predicted nucleic acid-binding protein
MVLVDTSVWIEHFRRNSPALRSLLEGAEVYCHPFVIGELACGNLKNRDEILSLLASLDKTTPVEDYEALEFVESNQLYGCGLGWIDIHLLSSALITGVKIWTLDRRLRQMAKRFDIAY